MSKTDTNPTVGEILTIDEAVNIIKDLEQENERLRAQESGLRVDKNEYDKCIVDLSNTINEKDVVIIDYQEENERLKAELEAFKECTNNRKDEYNIYAKEDLRKIEELDALEKLEQVSKREA